MSAPQSVPGSKHDSKGIPPVTAQLRTTVGKGEARRLRRSGLIPGIAYGKGLPSTPISIAPKDVLGVLTSELGRNSVVELSIAGGSGRKILVMIREYTYHPLTRDLEHVDFKEVRLDQPVDVDVPLIPLGKAVGVTTGGVLRQVYRTVPVRCLPDRIPAKFEIDISHLELGDHVSTKELKITEGVTVRLPQEQTLIAVVAPEKEEEVAAPVPGAAAVPGAPGAVPAAPGAAPAGAPGAAPGAAAAAPAAAEAPAKEGKKKSS